MDFDSDDFSGGSEDDDGMFDIFTGDIKGALSQTETLDGLNDGSNADAKPPPYVYGSLKGTNNIRVLDIEPDEKFEAPLRATMRLTSLSNPGKYLAISYAWGHLYTDGSHLSETIYIDGQRLKVTRSLESGLRRVRQHWISGQLRLKSAPLTVWIDGACIDQANQAERGLQVSLMGRIFGSCHALIIYLGENAEDTSERQFFQSPNFRYDTAKMLSNFKSHIFEAPGPVPSNRLDYREYCELSVVALRSLLGRPWFTRLWVVQEFCNGFGSRTRMLLGDFVLIGEAIIGLMSTLSDKLSPLIAGGSKSVINCPRPPLFFTRGVRYTSMLAFIQQCDDLCCSDDKDRVYGLLGVFKDAGVDIKANYSKAVEEIYHDLASELITNRNVIQMLACAISRGRSGNDEARRLPSWVPDWRTKAKYHSKSHKQVAERGMPFSVSSQAAEYSLVACIPGAENVSQLALAIKGCVLRPRLFFNDPGPLTLDQRTPLSKAVIALEPLDTIPDYRYIEDTPLLLLPSLGDNRALGSDLKQIIQRLALYDQYLCFFRDYKGAFVIRLVEHLPGLRMRGPPTRKCYELVSYLGLFSYTDRALGPFFTKIPEETIYLV